MVGTALEINNVRKSASKSEKEEVKNKMDR